MSPANCRTLSIDERSSFFTANFLLPVVCWMSWRAELPLEMLRQARITRAPREAKSRAVSRPMPVCGQSQTSLVTKTHGMEIIWFEFAIHCRLYEIVLLWGCCSFWTCLRLHTCTWICTSDEDSFPLQPSVAGASPESPLEVAVKDGPWDQQAGQ